MNLPVKVSVIICAYTLERLNDIYEAVDSVIAQTLKPGEVIISVDHNEELYRKLVEAYKDSPNVQQKSASQNRSSIPCSCELIPLKLVLNAGVKGLSETRNAGIRAAAGEIVAFLDDDAVAEKGWLKNLVAPFLPQLERVTGDDSANIGVPQRSVAAVGGRAIPQWQNGGRPFWFPEELDWIIGCTYKGLPLEGYEIRNGSGCNMAFDREILRTAGFFRSELGRTGKAKGVAEELELCLRIKHRMPGSIILIKPDAVIYHKIPRWRLNLKYVVRRSYDEGFCKSIVKSLSQTSLSEALSTESSYLCYLLLKSMPERLKHFYRKRSLSQVAVIMLSIVATGLGYLVNRLKLSVKTIS